jgi:hypothetical protein
VGLVTVGAVSVSWRARVGLVTVGAVSVCWRARVGLVTGGAVSVCCTFLHKLTLPQFLYFPTVSDEIQYKISSCNVVEYLGVS